MNSLLLTDGYKTGHHQQYPQGTQEVYSNWTARSLKYAPAGIHKVLSFGQSYAVQFIHDHFQKEFFSQDKQRVCQEMKEELSLYLNQEYDVSHFEALHDLGYLPIRVKAIAEGEEVEARIPLLTLVNTKAEFYWITNYLETLFSSLLWQCMTSASIALLYRRILHNWALKTDPDNLAIVDFQAHDFSMRGMGGIGAAIASGMGHAAVFKGSDSLPVIASLRRFYDAKGFVLGSVNATEHSVMCAGQKEDELLTFSRLLKTYPQGILSVVSDTWDLWNVLENILPQLKDQILNREGKLVIRPDSGHPADILCGSSKELSNGSAQEKGVVELLWDCFGGQINSQGYKVLDAHIGTIYGDSITPEMAEEICQRLANKGFASTNVVLGIGSYTYQYKTRDTFGFAMKATSVVIKGKRQSIFKDPITDNGIKKSACGLVKVTKSQNSFHLEEEVTEQKEKEGALKLIYENGKLVQKVNLADIRNRINQIIKQDYVPVEGLL
ncbi:nicotinate phosphoribosyltransferase [Croceimicrobium hydrocarbonivorans]|uniref:Nicotinamide phosphoribosyltransferase n=1 Tax=Croceimicrobium hydrocarbonivorans TaxID=2761580 RepID=A0A7H0VEL7_9FLAO|nr:nicotinate phosphoribosyltransferase [Croceimicrobium hydrocarbonivorans]QNR24165.1 nicotinate phosphoribosyltransferase [Croceimicrobium hydrocarbonivorans]